MPPLNARIIVTLELAKGIMILVFIFYFSKRREHSKFYTLSWRGYTLRTIMREFLEYVRLLNLATREYTIKMIFFGALFYVKRACFKEAV